MALSFFTALLFPQKTRLTTGWDADYWPLRQVNYTTFVSTKTKRQVDCSDSTVLCSSPISLKPSTENQGEFSQLKPSPIVESGAVMYQWQAVSGTSTAHLLQSSCHWGTWTHIRAANIKEKIVFIISGRAPQVFRDWSWHREVLPLAQELPGVVWLVYPSSYFGCFPTSLRKHPLLSLRRRGNRGLRTNRSYSFNLLYIP